MRYIWLFFKTLLRTILKPLSFLPAILMMYVIFHFSAQEGADSAMLSRKVSVAIVQTADIVLDKDWTDSQIEQKAAEYHYYVRKLAHFTEYFLLAVSVAFPLYVYGMRGIFLVLFAGAFCVGFAYLDEWHQSFVSGRTPSKKDVLVDGCGVFFGIMTTRVFGFIGRKTIFAPLAKHK